MEIDRRYIRGVMNGYDVKATYDVGSDGSPLHT